jgi:Holliday junction resolvase RusA-like endonuclease
MELFHEYFHTCASNYIVSIAGSSNGHMKISRLDANNIIQSISDAMKWDSDDLFIQLGRYFENEIAKEIAIKI